MTVKTGNVCTGCRVRKCRGALIDGETCAVCPVDHPRMLRWVSHEGVSRVLCANHHALLGRRRITWQEFLAEVSADHGWRAA